MQKGIECLPLNTTLQQQIYHPVLSKVAEATATAAAAVVVVVVVVIVNKNIRVITNNSFILSLSTKDGHLIKIHS